MASTNVMVHISIKKVIWIGVLITLIILFLVSLLLSKHKEIKILEKENISLTVRLQEARSQCTNLTEEKYYLYDVVEKVNDGLVSQTKSVIKLTKSFSKIKYVPIIVRDTSDALSPYRTDSTSRGF